MKATEGSGCRVSGFRGLEFIGLRGIFRVLRVPGCRSSLEIGLRGDGLI